jgi:hypothetical protein
MLRMEFMKGKEWDGKRLHACNLYLTYNFKVQSSGHCYFLCYIRVYQNVLMKWLPLLSSGQCSWLQIQRTWFYSLRYQTFWEVVGLERGSLSLVSTTEELLERTSSGSGLEIREYGRRDPSRWPRGTLYPQKLALTSPTSGGRTVGIVRLWTQATEFSLALLMKYEKPLFDIVLLLGEVGVCMSI